jgi:hypothetical protein
VIIPLALMNSTALAAFADIVPTTKIRFLAPKMNPLTTTLPTLIGLKGDGHEWINNHGA